MGAFTAGKVILLPFPFSDLSHNKLRPALLLAHAGRTDWIARQITSNAYSDPLAIELTDKSFSVGNLRRVSYVRPGKLFTANESLFVTDVGLLKADALNRVRDAVAQVILARH